MRRLFPLVFLFLFFSFPVLAENRHEFPAPIQDLLPYEDHFLVHFTETPDGGLTHSTILLFSPRDETYTALSFTEYRPLLSCLTLDHEKHLWAISYQNDVYSLHEYDIIDTQLHQLSTVTFSLPANSYLEYLFVHDDSPIIISWSPETQQRQCYIFDRSSNTLLPGALLPKESNKMALYKEGELLIITRETPLSTWQLASFHPGTGAIKYLVPINAYPNMLAYDASADQIAFMIDSMIYVAEPASFQFEVQGYLPVTDTADSRGFFQHNTFALSESNQILWTTVSSEFVQQANILRIADLAVRDEVFHYRQRHPTDIVTVIPTSGILFPADVGQLIMTGDRTYDVFILHTSLEGYQALLDKGYFFDLSDSMALTSLMDALHPALHDALYSRGKIAAVPLGIEFSSCSGLEYSIERLESYQIDPLNIPHNLFDFLSCMTQWYEDGLLQDVRLFDLNDQRMLISQVLMAYTEYYAAKENVADYTDPFLRALLDKTEHLIDIMTSNGCNDSSLPALFAFSSPHGYMENRSESSISGERSFYHDTTGYIPITLSSEHEPLYACSLRVAIVNPLSLQLDKAIKYVSDIAVHTSPLLQLYVFPAEASPVESPTYQHHKELLTAEIEAVRGRLANEPPTGDTDGLIDELNRALHSLSQLEQHGRWILAPDIINRYHQIENFINLSGDFETTMISGQHFFQLFSRYQNHELSLDRLLEELSRISFFILNE